MQTPKELGYPLLPRGAGSISWNKNAWEGRWLEQGERQYFRAKDYHAVYDELLSRWKRKQRGHYVPPAEMTVRDLVETYIDRQVAYGLWRPSTTHTHRRNAVNMIYPSIGDLRIMALDPPRLQYWIDQLARTYKPNTINACTSLLSAAYNHAVELTIVPMNPCRRLHHPKPQEVTRTTWTVEQIAALDLALQGDIKWLAVYRLMLSTGMRPGELRALRWSDIDFAKGRVRIRATITETDTGSLTVGEKTKSGKPRMVNLTAGPRMALLAWQAAQPRRSFDPKQDWVFLGSGDKPMSRCAWVRRHKKLIAQTKVPAISLHGLRHTSATLELTAGTPDKVVSERLGHKDPSYTARIYQHVDADLQQSAADALDERLFGELKGQLPERVPDIRR